MTPKTPAQLKEARHSLGFTCTQLAAACGMTSGDAINKIETGERRIGRTANVLIDILTGKLDPENPEHDSAYSEALKSLDGPTRMLIMLITGDLDLEDHLEKVRRMRGG